MYVHLEKVTETAYIGRGYDAPRGYEGRATFRLVFFGLVVGPQEIYLCGALRREGAGLRPSDLKNIARALIAEGFTHASVERHGRDKVWQLDRRL